MIIATWNVNSLNVRLNQVCDFLLKQNIDILCLQEIKLQNNNFPIKDINNIGYRAYWNGQKKYNGVAILSRYPCFNIIDKLNNSIDEEKRFLALDVFINLKKLRIINIYCPNGQNIKSQKFEYKVAWFKTLINHLHYELKFNKNLILAGDYNIAPNQTDIYDFKLLKNKILCSDKEIKIFKNILDIGLNDTYELFAPLDKNFTWWDYRFNSFKRNLGARIDHILISDNIKKFCNSYIIDNNIRNNHRPSDHAPVIIKLAI
ncbi:Exodeoxyribonuclease III [Candidatus Kinetoplastibacterium sorsogonicusi]|uniref:Exodeoxyribonuclease III n=1 Tax=Candidatus Kinetoplastidibacterium kentomonadis TaxID=1576550 RepID=A0A3Q8EWX0_9PROT|nr:exodeoxyribonuclease III [Candidatus Kinetoplastibacterium sorsogonicusi]AWD32390.1 Exodeoxyribonuclease III [Candidatus Kinetoplastibacterium sorsogonicusi]